MPTRVVTISHATGAGGETIGRTVADRLGFHYIDEEIITIAAEKEGVDAELVADTERRKGFLARAPRSEPGCASPRTPSLRHPAASLIELEHADLGGLHARLRW